MEDLTKQQLVLLTILVSFITSIATSITIVSILTDSTPIISKTINRIVERTIETVTLGSGTTTPAVKSLSTVAVTPTESEQLVAAVQKNVSVMAVISKKITDVSESVNLGIGFIIDGGLVVTDRNILWETEGLAATLRNGKTYSAEIAFIDEKTGIALLQLFDETGKKLSTLRAAAFSSDQPVLGETIYSLRGKTGVVLAKGVLTEIVVPNESSTSTPGMITYLGTTISLDKADRGASLFDIKGNMLGVAVTSTGSEQYFTSSDLISATVNAYTKSQLTKVSPN